MKKKRREFIKLTMTKTYEADLAATPLRFEML